MSQPETDFKYSLSRKDLVLVVSLAGDLHHAIVKGLEECKSQIEQNLDAKAIIIDFRGASQITFDAIPTLASIQKLIREKNIELRVSSLAEPLKDKLGKRGVIRSNEIRNDLREAVASVVRFLKPQPAETQPARKAG